MVSDFITRHIPIGDKGIVRKVQGGIVSHLDGAAIRVLAVSEELVHGIESITLDGIVGGEHKELRHVFLEVGRSMLGCQGRTSNAE